MTGPPGCCESAFPRGTFLMLSGVSVAAGAACALILAATNHQFQFGFLWRAFVISLTYSTLIAFPSALILIRLGRKRLAEGRKVGLLLRLIVLLGANLAGCLVAGLVLVVLGLDAIGNYWAQFRFALLFGTVITLLFGFSVSSYRELQAQLEVATLELRTRQMEEERARKLAAEARLASLESRIHPHFLFNTLNSIAALIPGDPKRAEDMIGKLAALLRFSLNANQTGLVPLGQELEIVRAYLDIEKARFDTRLRYIIDVSEDAQAIGVPPLAIESLVENSIKHVIAKRPEGGEICVRASATESRLDLEVSDNGPGFSMDEVPPGHGLDSLAGRLTLLFGKEGRLETARNGKYPSVRLSLPRQV